MESCSERGNFPTENSPYGITIDLSVYSLSSVKKTCYKFSSECSVILDKIDEDKIRINFYFPINVDEQHKKNILSDFYNELLDQDLREVVFKETEGIRNIILAQAFSKTSLINLEEK